MSSHRTSRKSPGLKTTRWDLSHQPSSVITIKSQSQLLTKPNIVHSTTSYQSFGPVSSPLPFSPQVQRGLQKLQHLQTCEFGLLVSSAGQQFISVYSELVHSYLLFSYRWFSLLFRLSSASEQKSVLWQIVFFFFSFSSTQLTLVGEQKVSAVCRFVFYSDSWGNTKSITFICCCFFIFGVDFVFFFKSYF